MEPLYDKLTLAFETRTLQTIYYILSNTLNYLMYLFRVSCVVTLMLLL
jgi:hypothetical protein